MGRRRVFVGNVDPQTTREELRGLLERLEGVLAVRVPVDHRTGEHRGFAFVDFRDGESAAQAMRGGFATALAGHRLRLSWAVNDPGNGTVRPSREPRGAGHGQTVESEPDPWADSGASQIRDYKDKRRLRARRGGKHGSDRRHGQGMRRFID